MDRNLDVVETLLKDRIRSSGARLKDLEEDYSSSMKRQETLQRLSLVLKNVQEKIFEDSISEVSDLISYGLGIVFSSRRISIQIEIGNHGSRKTAQINVLEKHSDYDVIVPLSEGVGGGIQVVVSFLLQVSVILRRDLAKYIFIDESFTQVSEKYTDGLFDLFRMLIDDFGFSIFLITHDRRFISRADFVYRTEGGKVISDD